MILSLCSAKGMLRGLGFNDTEIQGFISLFGALPELSVLYDSAMDEQTGAACHARIDGKGRTITIAKTKNVCKTLVSPLSFLNDNDNNTLSCSVSPVELRHLHGKVVTTK